MPVDRPAIPLRLILFFEFAALILREYVRYELLQSGADSGRAAHLSALAGFLAFAAFLSPLWRRLAPAISRGWRRPTAFLRLLVESVAVGVIMRLASYSLALSLRFLELRGPVDSDPVGPVAWWQCPPPGAVVLNLVVLVAATPLVEETVSRGLILAELRARRVPFAIAISAALFAIFHDPGTIPLAFLFGIVAGTQTIRQGTLWGAFVAHATFNALIVVDSDCLGLSWAPSPSVAAGWLLLAVTGALFLVALRIARAGGAGPKGPDRPYSASC